MAGNGSIASRRERAVESFESASKAIGPLAPGMSVFAVTRGQWSMIDAIMYALDELGGGYVSVWTWVVAEYEIKTLSALMGRGDLAGATLIVDMSADKRNAELLTMWRRFFGPDSVKICRNHAKLARVWNDDMRLLLRGSMNLNWNPRFEQFDMTEGGLDFELVEEIEAGLRVLPERYKFSDVALNTKLGCVFSDEVLAKFGSLSPVTDFQVGRLEEVERA